MLTYPGLRLGNILYFALHAHLEQSRGVNYRVLDPAPADDWARALPGLRPLLLHPDGVRRTDRRHHIPPTFYQHFGVDFTAAELEAFVRDKLLDTVVPTPDGPGHDVVINVRRGDYYSDDAFREQFGFDVVSYTRAALARLEADTGPAKSVLVVSDDPDWCSANMGFLHDVGAEVAWSSRAEGPMDNLRSLARGRRLIITNSTFSYWGAYISNVLQGNNRGHVWAPKLHSRGVNGGQPWQHDPHWHTLEVAEP